MSRPTLTIIAGSNGCGKSTLTASARSDFQDAPVLDPDAVAKSLQQGVSGIHSDLEAGKQILSEAENLLATKQSFTVETTLSGNNYLRMARRAQGLGYAVVGIIVGTASVEINMRRIQARVLKGGHDISEEDQRRRYPRTLANIAKLLPLCDFRILFDNSTEQGHQLVGFGHEGYMRWIDPVPAWASELRKQLESPIQDS